MRPFAVIWRLVNPRARPPLDTVVGIIGSAALWSVPVFVFLLWSLGPHEGYPFLPLAFPVSAGTACAFGLGRVVLGLVSHARNVGPDPHSTPLHQSLRLWFVWWSIALALGAAIAGSLVVIATGSPRGYVVDTTVLLPVATILFLGLLTRYTTRSFSVDVQTLADRTEQASQNTRDAILTTSSAQVAAFQTNTTAILQEFRDQAMAQRQTLEELKQVMERVANYLQDQIAQSDAQRRAAEEAVERAQEAERQRERERIAAEQAAEEATRLAVMPRLAFQVRVVGPVFHHVWVDVLNQGLAGQGLQLELRVNGSSRGVLNRGDIRSHGIVSTDWGDVARLPLTAAIEIQAGVADIAGRRYEFGAQFQYARRTGLFGITVGTDVSPTGFVPGRPVE